MDRFKHKVVVWQVSLDEFMKLFIVLLNRQASGNQVKSNAAALGATFQTQIVQIETGVNDYECSILDTNRVYDKNAEDIFSNEYFILEVAVQQLVYVSSSTLFSIQNVTAIVETGFNRGSGGRVKFMSLLRADPFFFTIINVNVLNGSLSTPQLAPSTKPSLSPSRKPSVTPSMFPSGTPTISTSIAPTASPSFSPSKKPSKHPSFSPTEKPSNAPSKESGFDRQPLILGVIAGGVATIIVSCFFIFCVWYPFCWRKDNNRFEDVEAIRHRRRRHSISSQSSSESSHVVKAMIPGLLHLDDDSRSLANTTVTLGTATRPPPIYSNANMKAWKKRTNQIEPVSMLDSFDESSVYTSIFTSSATDHDKMHNTDSTAAIHPIATEESKEEEVSASESASDVFDLEYRFDRNFGYTQEDLDSDPFKQAGQEKQGPKLVDSESGPFVVMQDVADALSHTNVGVGSNSLNSHAEDSDSDLSMDLSSSLGISDASFGPPIHDSILKARLSTNLVATNHSNYPNQDSDRISEVSSMADFDWEKERLAKKFDIDALSSSSLIADSSATLPSSSIASAANNSLLRSILEDARLRANKQSNSTRSRASGGSAPSRLTKTESAERLAKKTESQRLPLFPDILADNAVLSSDWQQSRSPARSVGALPSSTPRSSLRPAKFTSSTKYLDPNSVSTEHDNDTGRFGRIGRPPLSSSSSKHDDDSSAQETPTSSNLTSINRIESLGARRMTLELSTDGNDDLVTPSSPGMLNRLTSPWLNATTPLGARPRTPSSTRSGWSTGSQSSIESATSCRSEKSGYDSIHRDRPNSLFSASDSMKNRILGEHKASSSDISPESLKTNRLHLERRLVDDFRVGDSSIATDYCATSIDVSSSPSTELLRRVVVVAPPGKLGVTLADHHDGKGIIVSSVRSHSSVKGKLRPGDKLVAVDDDDVTNMMVSNITAMMASRSSKERRLTLVTTKTDLDQPLSQETKHEGSP